MSPAPVIRAAAPGDFPELGQLMVAAYAALDGFPKPHQQPKYYEMLANIGAFAAKPDTLLLVATADGKLAGGVVYIADMAQYGSGGTATREPDAAGFRLLAVRPEARGLGIGRALAGHCVQLAKAAGRRQVILHSTKAMTTAWGLYLDMGFERSPDLDFLQGDLEVFGFRLAIQP